MQYYVYVLKSAKDGSLYIGMSKDPQRRLKEHNLGYSKYTKGHRPYNFLYKEGYPNRLEARDREKYLKTGQGRDFLKSFI
ncbi:MAG: GIY-YIG nuclease family protein [Candidatus Omnitrophica bacterium]|nr:GIY-YIG nuclease family protein [Candidatus Omnitrophota bacterium]